MDLTLRSVNVYYRKILFLPYENKLLTLFNNSVSIKSLQDHYWTILISNFNRIRNIYTHNNTIFFTGESNKIHALYRLESWKEPEQITYFEDFISVIGFIDSNVIIKCGSSWVQKFYLVNLNTKEYIIYDKFSTQISRILFLPNNQVLLGVDGACYLNWRGYKGGAIGKFWYNHKEITFDGNIVNIQYNSINQRVYFIGELNGSKIGNIYSSTLEGKDVIQHTFEEEYTITDYSLANNFEIIYYICGGELKNTGKKEIYLMAHSRSQKLYTTNPAKYITDLSVSLKHEIAYISRGILFISEPGCSARQYENYQHITFLNQGRICAVKNNGSVDIIQKGHIFNTDIHLEIIDNMQSYDNKVIVVTGKNTLHLITVNDDNTIKLETVDTNSKNYISYSLYKDWIAYSYTEKYCEGQQLIKIKNLADLNTVIYTICDACSPCFASDGKFLSFLFGKKLKCMVANLDPDSVSLISGFKPYPEDEGKDDGKSAEKIKEDVSNSSVIDSTEVNESVNNKESNNLIEIEQKINFINIEYRSESLDLDTQFILFANSQGILSCNVTNCHDQHMKFNLSYYSFATRTSNLIASGVQLFDFNENWIVAVIEHELYTTKISEPITTKKEAIKEESGFWKLQSFYINRTAEWNRVLYEAWLLQKHYFNNPKVIIDWDNLLIKYQKLSSIAYSKSDIEEIIALMHGDLQSSHAYVIHLGDKDYNNNGFYNSGSLCADISYINNAWEVSNINKLIEAPLSGLPIAENSQLIAIDGQLLSAEITPAFCLIDKANKRLRLRFSGYDKEFYVVAATVKDANKYAYQYHVDLIANKLKEQSIWYVHLPDMLKIGNAEFDRQYLSKTTSNQDLKYLLLDIRRNRGGNISEWIRQILCQKRLGTSYSTVFGSHHYPSTAPPEKIVCLIDEYTGSDGDLMAYAIKKLKLGPVYGQRTWGGLIGIWPRNTLLDGTITSQPEFVYYFDEEIENKGVSPDIEVKNNPYLPQYDQQLEFAINKLLNL